METITANLRQNIDTKLKGKNGRIVREIYAKTGNKPLWIGAKNSQKMAELIQALKDPLFNYKTNPSTRKRSKSCSTIWTTMLSHLPKKQPSMPVLTCF
jgi:hypothetical protein